jgi:predicted nucleic acid-binding protein
MSQLFLDASFIIALEDADDQNHEKAINFWNGFKKNPQRLITTTYVFNEIVTFLKRRISYDKASHIGEALLSSSIVELIHISNEDFIKGWNMFLKYHDKDFSFTDCISFLLMNQRGIKEAMTFDKHFRQMGFLMSP